MTVRLLHGDCVELMRTLEPGSVDAVVCDPPYELNFMGREWDRAGVAFDPATWREALRVLKPGGYLLAFGGTRTVHRLAVAIEDAGFEIRDRILYGASDEDICACPPLRDGASPRDGDADREDALANGSGASPGPRSAEQHAGEPRTLAGQSQPQDVGVGPYCPRCGRPRRVGEVIAEPHPTELYWVYGSG